VTTFRVIGPGRAGSSLAAALCEVGHRVVGILGRGDPVEGAAHGVDALVVATPDDTVAEVAARVAPSDGAVVLHLSGSLGLDALAPHPRRASLHPLVPLPSVEVGRARLRSGVPFAVAGDPLAGRLAAELGGRAVEVGDEQRTAYHAAAAIAANHLVALLGQVERVAASAGLPLDAFADLVRAATDDALALGPRAALTGPASRGDWRTIERHRRALAELPAPRTELAAYDAMVGLARRLRLDTAPSMVVAPPAVSTAAGGTAGLVDGAEDADLTPGGDALAVARDVVASSEQVA